MPKEISLQGQESGTRREDRGRSGRRERAPTRYDRAARHWGRRPRVREEEAAKGWMERDFGPIVAKMILDRFPELRALSEAEKMQLAEELYGAALQELPHLSEDEIQAELERSMDEYRRDPASASDWRQVKARILARRHAA